ncbi:MAG: DinB family protein [Bacteroidia bacterium]
MKLQQFTFDKYYEVYTKHAQNSEDIIQQLLTQHMDTIDLVTSLDDETLYTPYDEGKWSIMEILVHLMDTERIFCYRALRIARKDKSDLPGFDQDLFVKNSRANKRKILDVVKEFSVLRSSTIELFNSFDKEMLNETGSADGKQISVGAIPYILCGHEIHHVNIIENKYIGKY